MIGDHFVQDHREIDAAFDSLLRSIARLQGAEAADALHVTEFFRSFHDRLDRHIRWEEEILFPAVEERAPELADGPGKVMRVEHVEIRTFLQQAGDALAGTHLDEQARQDLLGALRSLGSVLADHNEKEEAVYYPLCDELFTAGEATQILDQVRNSP